MSDSRFNVLVLDGGGSKGVYSLGVLRELELRLGEPLYKTFDLVFGTSTGSIIGSLIALGYTIPQIETLYLKLIPEIMSGNSRKAKSKALQEQAEEVFGTRKFDSFKTNIGIVALNYDSQFPLIFKSDIKQAHGMVQSFLPGFGCTIAEAVCCSSSAYPFFDKMKINTPNHGPIEVVDGGFIANNATLYAMIDAYKSIGNEVENIHLFNVGVGQYIEKSSGWLSKVRKRIGFFKFVERVLAASTNSNMIVSQLLFKEVDMLRVSDSFPEPEHGTNMFEADEKKLKKMIQLGRTSYAKHEAQIIKLLNLK